jgi:hypothetical protein
MKVIIHLTKEEETNALPLLLRHSPGMVLPNRTYVLSEDAVRVLRKAGIGFSELGRETLAPSLEEVVGGQSMIFLFLSTTTTALPSKQPSSRISRPGFWSALKD